MKIHFISHADDNLASRRMRVNKPVELLNLRGHEVTVSEEADAKAEVNVFQKHMDQHYDQTMAAILKGHSKVAFDISDDHFDKEAGEHYKTMISTADIITCNGRALIDRCKPYANGKPIHCVKDPITFPYFNAGLINLLEPKLLWFGHASNFGTMIPLLEKFKDPLTVITNKEVTGPFKFEQWEVGKVESQILNYDIVVLPLKEDASKHTKNNNRAVDAIHSGRFVVTDSPEVYGSLKEFIFIGDISEGIEWAKANPDKAVKKIRAGQEFVQDMYSDIRIGDQWEYSLTGYNRASDRDS